MKCDRTLDLGKILITKSAQAVLHAANADVSDLLERHRSCDWGDTPEDGKTANERALASGTEVSSNFRLQNGMECVVVTGSTRNLTVVLTMRDMPILLNARPDELEHDLRLCAGATAPEEMARESGASVA